MEQGFTQENGTQQQFNREVPPPNYMVWAVLSTLFCCLPLGIVSIIKASEVNSKWIAGDYEGARISSENAKKWATISAIIGVVLVVLSFILYFAVLAAFLSGVDPHTHY